MKQEYERQIRDLKIEKGKSDLITKTMVTVATAVAGAFFGGPFGAALGSLLGALF